MNRLTDLQDENQTVSIDITYRVLGGTLYVLDWDVFENDDQGGWVEVLDKEKARKLYNRFIQGLVYKALENKEELQFNYVCA